MSNPRFSIVIPTCERHETLHYCIQSALAQQDFDDYEIIVSDNASSPATRETVEAFQSEKIRYIRTPRRLAMTNNFEFAVAHSTGDYVIVIGDDDGLMPDALRTIDEIATRTGHKAIRWESIYYYWPNMLKEKNRNVAAIAHGTQEVVFNGETTINNVINDELHYTLLPMLYHSAIHRDLINELKAKTGSVFKSRSPDIYSGFAIAYLAKQYLYCGQAYSIMGLSGKSNGWAYMLNQQTMMQDFESSNQTDEIRCHPSVPEFPGLLTITADSFHYAKDALFPERTDLHYEEKYFIISSLVRNYRPFDEAGNIEAFRRVLAKRPMMLQWLNTVVVPNMKTIKAEAPQDMPPSCITPTICDLNVAQAYGIYDVYALTQQYRKIVDEQRLLYPAQAAL